MSKLTGRISLAWVFIIALHLVFFIAQLNLENWYLSDSEEYLAEAENILSDGSFYAGDLDMPLDYDLYTKRPPLYPLFLAGVFYILPGPVITGFIQMLISILSLYLIYRLFGLYNVHKTGLWLMLLFLLLTPAQLIYTQLIMSEILFQLVITLMFFLLVLLIEQGEKHNWLWSNLLLIAGMLIKPVLYLFAIPKLLMGVWLSVRFKTSIYVLTVLIPIILIGLYFSWNYSRTGYAHFSSITNINLLHYNAYFLLIQQNGSEYADSTVDAIEAAAASKSTYAGGEAYLREASSEVIRDNLTAYVVFHLKGVIHFFVDPGRFDLYNFFGIESEDKLGLLYYYSKDGYAGIWEYLRQQPLAIILLLPLIMLGNILKAMSMVIFLFSPKPAREVKVMLLLIVLYIAFATGPLGASRFSLPVFLLLMFTLPFSLEYLQGRLQKRKLSA